MKIGDIFRSASGKRVKAPPVFQGDDTAWYEGFVAATILHTGVPAERIPETVQTLRLQVDGLRGNGQPTRPMQAELLPPPTVQPALPPETISDQADSFRKRGKRPR